MLPHLNYSLLLWGRTYGNILDNLFKLQKRVIRNICNAHYRCNTAPLFKMLKVLTLSDLYNYQLGIFMYKFHTGALPDTFIDFYSTNAKYHDFNTRNKYSLSHPYCRTIQSRTQIRGTGVHLWNSLDQDLKNSNTLNSFKSKLKQHLLENSMNQPH